VNRAELAQRLWTDARDDAHLLGRLRAEYRGSLDVTDALWWRAHPLTPAPTGRPDPASELAPLKERVYARPVNSGARDGTEPLLEFVDPISLQMVTATESEHRLRALTLRLEEDAKALDELLDRLDTREAGARPSAAALPGETAPPDTASASGAVPTPRRLMTLLLVGLGAVAGVAGMVGVGLLVTAPERGDKAPASSSVATPSRTELLQIFAEPSNFPPGFDRVLGGDYRAESVRSIPNPGANRLGYATYVAQQRDGDYCLILLHPDQTTDTACAPETTIAEVGLKLDAVVVPVMSGSRYPQRFAPIEATVYWDPAGVFNAAFTPLLPR
jgi:hypothetical protein